MWFLKSWKLPPCDHEKLLSLLVFECSMMFWKENKWTFSPSRPSVFPHKDKPSADRMESLQVTCLCFWANIQNTWVGLWISHRMGTCVYGSIFLFWCSSRGRGGVFLKCFMSYISSHPRSQSSKKETARRIWRRMGSASLRESSVLVETEKEHARYYRYYRIVDCATLLISFAHFGTALDSVQLKLCEFWLIK